MFNGNVEGEYTREYEKDRAKKELKQARKSQEALYPTKIIITFSGIMI